MLKVLDPGLDPLTLDEAKAQCRVEIGDEDALIEGLIRSARGLAEAHCRRTLAVDATYRLTLDYEFPCRIDLPKPPLRAVVSLRYVDAAGDWQTLDPASYQVADAEPAFIVPAYGLVWPAVRWQPAAIEVTYRAGYGAAAEIPATARQAVALLVGHYYANREAVTAGTMMPLPLAVESLLVASDWGSYP